MKIFEFIFGKILGHIAEQFEYCRILRCSSLSHVLLVYQKSGQKYHKCFLERVFWHVKWRYWRDFSGMIRKKIEFFPKDVIKSYHIFLQVMPFLISKFSFFGHIVVFCQCGLKSRTVLESWVPLPFYSWNRTEQWISQPFPSGSQSPWNDFNNIFFRSSSNFPCLIETEQYVYCSRGRINFWSHLDEERPQKPQFFYRNPSHCHIKSIKSTSKRSQKTK